MFSQKGFSYWFALTLTISEAKILFRKSDKEYVNDTHTAASKVTNV